MKVPSLLKIPRHQRFNYEPRYYDPIKEEIDEKRSRIRRILNADKKSGKSPSHTRLEGAFSRKLDYQMESPFLRLFIGGVLFTGVVGFLYFGNIAVYITISLVLGYLVLKKFILK